MAIEEWLVRREYRTKEAREELDRVVIELPLEIRVNGVPLVALMRLPGDDKELAVGFCLTEKVIPSVSSINILRHCGQMSALLASGESSPAEEEAHDRGDVVELEVKEPKGTERFKETFVVRTGCGGADLSAIDDDVAGIISSEAKVPREVLLSLAERLTAGQEVFRSTGGTHGAGIFTPLGELVVVMEDIGRHNALDKAVGYCALKGIPLSDKILVLSGRVSYEMVLKAVRVGIPMVVSLAAPTSLGLRIAERAGCTVVGFLDGERFNIYTHTERVTD